VPVQKTGKWIYEDAVEAVPIKVCGRQTGKKYCGWPPKPLGIANPFKLIGGYVTLART